jgi:4-hydroxy-tetrahydrodipicolinate synthase
MYECPYPRIRLLSTAFIRDCAQAGSLVFLKDVSCRRSVLVDRIAAAAGTGLSLFNANTATLLDFFLEGGDGYSGIMGNFHIDLYKWLYTHYETEPELSREVSDFLTMAGAAAGAAYPLNAKYHCSLTGIPMGFSSRLGNKDALNENARLEVAGLIRSERTLRQRLGLPPQP